ncbi:MAG: 30S ribosomal protein S20 [Chitinispirillaceae bacterium]|nr:30S ribosomal protein S20 [Chitinispirillaceae bacterium]
MQRHKSAKKAARQSNKANIINRALQSRTKVALRHVLESKNRRAALPALQKAFSLLDKCVKGGLVHANNASNKKSRLCKFVNKLAE